MSLVSTFYFGNSNEIYDALRSIDAAALTKFSQTAFSGGISQPFLLPDSFESLLSLAPNNKLPKTFTGLVAEQLSPHDQNESGTYRLKPNHCATLAQLDRSILQTFTEQWNASQKALCDSAKRARFLGSRRYWAFVGGFGLAAAINYIKDNELFMAYVFGGFWLLITVFAITVDRPRRPRQQFTPVDWVPSLHSLQTNIQTALNSKNDIVYHWSL